MYRTREMSCMQLRFLIYKYKAMNTILKCKNNACSKHNLITNTIYHFFY